MAQLFNQIALVACGVGATMAWSGGFYASVLFLILVTLCLAVPGLRRAHVRQPVVLANTSSEKAVADRAILRAVLDQAPTPLLVAERNGRVRALNRVARAMFKTDDILTQVPDAFRDGSLRLRHHERNYRIDRIEAQRAGTARTILSLIDIESEERIAEARATRELLRVLSHEVMNALTPIASLAESALASLDDPAPSVDRLRNMIGTLSRRAAGLLRFTQAYRSLARLPEPVLAPAPLPTMFRDLAGMFEARWAGRVEFVTRTPPESAVPMDRDQISQALWALLQNAAEAALGAADAPSVGLSVGFNERIAFLVSDNGPGIPDGERSRIFQPFYTTKENGTGVGLSLARQIAHAHGGSLRLLPTASTTFELSLPTSPSATG